MGLRAINFPGHKFDIALRLRMDLPSKERIQGNRKYVHEVQGEGYQNEGSEMGPAWDPPGSRVCMGRVENQTAR